MFRFFILQIIAIFSLSLIIAGCDTNISNRKREFLRNKTNESLVVIEVIGSDNFINQTKIALDLLEKSSPDALLKVQKYIGRIEQGKHSGMWAYENPPRFVVNDRTAFFSETWYAGSIAHDATHSELYHQYQACNKGKVPDKAWKEGEAELICMKYQLEVMKRLGAPQNEINYLELNSSVTNHSDLDRDGDYDWFDYWKRNW